LLFFVAVPAVIARCFSLLFEPSRLPKIEEFRGFRRLGPLFFVEEQRKQRRLAVAAVLP